MCVCVCVCWECVEKCSLGLILLWNFSERTDETTCIPILFIFRGLTEIPSGHLMYTVEKYCRLYHLKEDERNVCVCVCVCVYIYIYIYIYIHPHIWLPSLYGPGIGIDRVTNYGNTWLTNCINNIHLHILVVTRPVRIFCALHGTGGCSITSHWTLSRASWVQSALSHSVSLRSTYFTLLYHLSLFNIIVLRVIL